jgi:hypothetical protein
MLGPNSPLEEAHEAHHAHGAGSDAGAHPAQLEHHCQCPAHRGVAPSGSVAFATPFLMSESTGLPAPVAGFWLAIESKLRFGGLFPSPDRPVPIFLS